MKPHYLTLMRIIDLAERLSDTQVNFSIDIDNFAEVGMTVSLAAYRWAPNALFDGSRLVDEAIYWKPMYDYTLTDMLMYLEQIEHHGFRDQSIQPETIKQTCTWCSGSGLGYEGPKSCKRCSGCGQVSYQRSDAA